MRCPKCQIDVPTGFSTCAVCRTPLESSGEEGLGDQRVAGGLSDRLAGDRATGPHQPPPTGSRAPMRTGPQPRVGHTGPSAPGQHDGVTGPSDRGGRQRAPMRTGPQRSARPHSGEQSQRSVPAARSSRPSPHSAGEQSQRSVPVARAQRGPSAWPRDPRKTGPEWPAVPDAAGLRPPADGTDAASVGAASVGAASVGAASAGAEQARDPGEALAREVPPGEQGELHTRILDLDPQVEKGTRMIDVQVPAVVRRAQRREEAERKAEDDEPANPLEETFAAASQIYARMSRVDRWIVWVLGFCLLAAFMPWTYVRGVGLVSGIESYGLVSAGAVLLAGFVVYRRTTHRAAAGLYLLLQLLAVAGICAAPIYWLIVGLGVQMSWGMLATLGGGAAALVLTLARLVRPGP